MTGTAVADVAPALRGQGGRTVDVTVRRRGQPRVLTLTRASRHQRRRHGRTARRAASSGSASPPSPPASAGRSRGARRPSRGGDRPASSSTCATTPAAWSTRPSRSPAPSSTAGRSSPTTGAAPASRPSTRARRRHDDPARRARRRRHRERCRDRGRRAAGPRPRGRRRHPHLRQGLGAGAVHALRRLGHRAHRRQLRHAGRAGPSTASGIEPDISVDARAAPASPRRRALDVLTGLVAAVGPRRAGLTHATRTGPQLVAQNKKARHDYHIEDIYEAGLVLTGTEVKSLRAGRASLVDGFAHDQRRRGLAAQRAHPGVHPGHVDQPRAAAGAQAAAAPRPRSTGWSARPRSPA